MASPAGCYAGLLPDTWGKADGGERFVEKPLREVWVLQVVHRPIILSFSSLLSDLWPVSAVWVHSVS